MAEARSQEPSDTFDKARSYGLAAALIAGFVLALARFLRYIDVVQDIDADFAQVLAWWSIWVAGVGLLVVGGAAHFARDHHEADRGFLALLVGLLLLALMPAQPSVSVSIPSFFNLHGAPPW